MAISVQIPVSAPRPQPNLLRTAAAVVSLTKPGLTLLVLATTFCGYFLGANGAFGFAGLVQTLAGTALVAAGALALNEFAERDLDALMPRTMGRPLPSGRIDPAFAFRFGAALAVAGFVLLTTVGLFPALFAACAFCLYLFAYTPLKRGTRHALTVGSLAGALPPLIGCSAAGALTSGAWIVFAILFLWQIPHFLAVGWRWRDDYAAARVPTVCVIDRTGRTTGRMALISTAALFLVSLAPSFCAIAGRFYFATAGVIGIGLLCAALAFARTPTQPSARRLFLATIIYLPILLAILALDG